MIEISIALLIFFIPSIITFLFVLFSSILPGLIKTIYLSFLFSFQFYDIVIQAIAEIIKTLFNEVRGANKK